MPDQENELNFTHVLRSPEASREHMVGDLTIKPIRCGGHWHACVEDDQGNGMSSELKLATRGMAIAAALDMTNHLFPDRVVTVADDDDQTIN